jgi:hypothetical protein
MSPQCRFSCELDITAPEALVLDLHPPSREDTIGRDSYEEVRSGKDGVTGIDTFRQVDQLNVSYGHLQQGRAYSWEHSGRILMIYP